MDHSASTDRAVADIARRQHGLVTLEQLGELGLTRRQRQWRLRTGRWDTPYTGVYRISGLPASWRSDLLAACLAGDGVASHRSAASLWDLPGGRRDHVELITERWEREQHAGLIVHESLVLDDVDKVTVDGMPATSIERTIFDLCANCPEVVVDMAIDRALGRELVDHARLVATEARLATRGRRGAAMFHRIMSRRSDAARTPGERGGAEAGTSTRRPGPGRTCRAVRRP